MIDNTFTEKIKAWLEQEHSTVEQIKAGAKLLLLLNRDNAMYQRIMRRPLQEASFVEYKLKRFLRMRMDGSTINDTLRMDSYITPRIEAAMAVDEEEDKSNSNTRNTETTSDNTSTQTSLPADTGSEEKPVYIRKGIRPDHDRLPANIQRLWTRNAERWKKIKETFNTCKMLTEPCDRYEHLKLLKETWYAYKQDMARYDEYVLTPSTSEDNKKTTLTDEQRKQLANAYSYISRNIDQLMELLYTSGHSDEEQQQTIETMRSKIQERVNTIIECGKTMSEEMTTRLHSCGIVTEKA